MPKPGHHGEPFDAEAHAAYDEGLMREHREHGAPPIPGASRVRPGEVVQDDDLAVEEE